MSRLRKRPQIEHGLKNEDDLRNKADLKNKDDIKNEDNLKNEDDLKKEDDHKNEDNLKNEDDLKNEDNLKNSPSPKIFLPSPPPHKKLPDFFLMTSYLDSHMTTDVKPDMLSGVRTGNGIPHDKHKIRSIAHALTNRKNDIFILVFPI